MNYPEPSFELGNSGVLVSSAPALGYNNSSQFYPPAYDSHYVSSCYLAQAIAPSENSQDIDFFLHQTASNTSGYLSNICTTQQYPDQAPDLIPIAQPAYTNNEHHLQLPSVYEASVLSTYEPMVSPAPTTRRRRGGKRTTDTSKRRRVRSKPPTRHVDPIVRVATLISQQTKRQIEQMQDSQNATVDVNPDATESTDSEDPNKKKDPFDPKCAVPLPYEIVGGVPGMVDCFAESSIWRRNERERMRVRCVNDGYLELRQQLPMPAQFHDKRLSKVETLRLAIRYIHHMELLLADANHDAVCECVLEPKMGANEFSDNDSEMEFFVKPTNKKPSRRGRAKQYDG